MELFDPHTLAITESLPAIGKAALFVVAIVGLVIWALGGKLLRPACTLAGGAAGAALGAMLARSMGAGDSATLWIIAGGIAGAIAAYMLFRVWAGLGLAIVLTVLAPLSVLVWVGSPAPQAGAVLREQTQDVDVSRTEGWREHAGQVWKAEKREATRWWKALGEPTRLTVVGGAVAGAVAGMLVGFMRPKLAAKLQTAIVGSAVLIGAGFVFVRFYAPQHAVRIPDAPKAFLLVLGLITATGLVVQWAISRPKADTSLNLKA